MTHTLKCWPQYFQAIVGGTQPYALQRENTHHFSRGDTLVLQEYDPQSHTFTGCTYSCEIIGEPLRDTTWLQPGVAVLSIRELHHSRPR